MAWSKYRNSVRYYRKVREGNKVRSIYLGNGPEAQAAAKAIETSTRVLAELKQLKDRDKTLDDQINLLISQGSSITANVLTIAGFQLYQRQWKLKKTTTKN